MVALLFVPVALLVAALLLMLSGYAGSYKEAQLFAFPVQLLVMVPALAPVLPNLELRSAIVAVPIANVAVACRDVLTGVFDWPMLAAVVLINTGLALQLARFVTRALEQERLMAPAAADDLRQRGGAVTFQHHVLRWSRRCGRSS